ncbi:MAG: GNAT family N-acetyltransferase [Saprospiraceae bacterium]
MKKIIETHRLLIREFNLSDAPFIVALLNSPGWLRFIGDRGVHTEEDAQNYLLNGPMKSYQANGFGLWRVSLKSDDSPIGMCGLLKRDTLDDPDIGFAMLPEFAQNGYAFEMADATMRLAKTDFDMGRVVAITDAENERSIALLLKIGLAFEKTIQFPGADETLLLFGSKEQ